jgi:hypothetical protein
MTIAQYENASGAEYAGYTMRFGPSSFAKPLVVPKPVVTPPVTIPVPTPPLGASDRIPHGGVLAADKALYAGDYKLDVQADGNLVIRKWDSVTGTWKVTKNFLTNLRSALKRVVKGTQWLSVGTDDHVVLYGKNAKGERQVIYTFPWPLPHNRGAYFQLDSKGNLVTRAASGEWIWHLK